MYVNAKAWEEVTLEWEPVFARLRLAFDHDEELDVCGVINFMFIEEMPKMIYFQLVMSDLWLRHYTKTPEEQIQVPSDRDESR